MIAFLVKIELDDEGDGTVPSEDDVAGCLAYYLGQTYPIDSVEVEVAA